jgi:LEA14-like dessication related protein
MRLKAALISALVLVSASCAGLGKGGFKDPVVTFKNVRVGGIGLSGGTLDIVLSVYNPNGYRLDASRLTYQLMVDSLPVGNGALDKHFSVNSNDSTDVELPLHFKWNGVSAAGRKLMNNGTVPYRVLGDLTVGSGVGDFTIQYDRAGSFNSLSGATR